MNLPDELDGPRGLIIKAGLGLVILVLLLLGGVLVYIKVIKDDAPPRLTLGNSTSASLAPGATDGTTVPGSGGQTSGELDGTWTIAEGSLVGYRAKEVLLGQNAEAVGRTSDVTGNFTFVGTTLQAAQFTVDMTTIASDEDRRDGQFHGRIMDTKTYPTANFKLTAPVTIASLPAKGETFEASVSGTFTIRGVTKNVTIPLTLKADQVSVDINGLFPVTFADYGIPDPSFGPAKVQGNGEIEFLLKFKRS